MHPDMRRIELGYALLPLTDCWIHRTF